MKTIGCKYLDPIKKVRNAKQNWIKNNASFLVDNENENQSTDDTYDESFDQINEVLAAYDIVIAYKTQGQEGVF